MAVHSTSLGSVKVTGQEALAFSRKITHARGTKAASESALKGKALTTSFLKKGYVKISLKSYNKAKTK